MADAQEPKTAGPPRQPGEVSSPSSSSLPESDIPEALDVADTVVSKGPKAVPPAATSPAAAPPAAAPPAATPPAAGAGRSRTVLGASGAATRQPARTAPEIGADSLEGVMGLDALPQTEPERWIGQVVGDRYRVIRVLGQGGMGVVYLAEHVVIEKKVALKVLNEELSHSRDVVSRFIGEARAASRIGHENIVDITDFGTTASGGVFFVMEYLDGVDLSDRLQRVGRFSWDAARDVAVQICRALAAAHSKGIIHRDLKPENVFLIRHAGKDDFVKILDFGIAKFTGMEGGEPKKTKTGVIFGTPDYMSPEQAEGKKADHRVDIYALGVILYELVTGRLPFQAETFMGVLHQHMTKAPQPPRELVPDIPPDFEAVLLRALEKAPDERYQTMEQLESELDACTGEAAPVLLTRPIAMPPSESAPADDEGPGIPPLKPQSDLATGKLPAVAASGSGEALPSLPSLPSPEESPPRSSLPLVILLLTIGLGVGAFFLVRHFQKQARQPPSPAGELQSRTVTPMVRPPPVPEPDAASAMSVPRPPPPMPVTPESVTINVVVTNRRLRARAYLDGKLLGRLPLRNRSIPYSTQERVLEIRARGHKTIQIRFTPDANQSWKRRMRRGRGTTKVGAMSSSQPHGGMGSMESMGAHARPISSAMGQMRAAPMPPVMRVVIMGLKDPFPMSR